LTVPVFERILTTEDPRLADYRGVSDPERLKAHRLFIAEGRLVVTRLLGDERWRVRSILVSEAANRDLERVFAAAAPCLPVFVCAAADFAGITGHHIHRGCLALVEAPCAIPLEDAIAGSELVVVLDGVTNPDNIGGVFRNAAAFAADLVVLSPACCSPLYRKAVRTSMGATLRVPFVHLNDQWPEALAILRDADFTLIALTTGGGSQPLAEFSAPQPQRLALIVGAEGPGLTPAAERAADHHVRIPIAADVDSLNLAVAVGIALEQLTRNRGGRGILAAPPRAQT
jgi:tRNA G18 (ribose-2'-O)-methylase SpoU